MSELGRKRYPAYKVGGGVTFFWCYTVSVWYMLVWVVLPHTYKDQDSAHTTALITGHFLLLEMLLFWFLSANLNPSKVKRNMLQKYLQAESAKDYATISEMSFLQRTSRGDLSDGQTELPPGWYNCSRCELAAPPRAHHCHVCGCCVLRQDHHCWFTAACVGQQNQKHFMAYLLYVSMGSCFIIYQLYNYLYQVTGVHLLSIHGYQYLPIVAIVRWTMGSMATTHLVVLLQVIVSLLTFCFSSGFFVWEWMLILRGQTTYEYSHNIYENTTHAPSMRSMKNHVRHIWGSEYLIPLHFLLPLPWSVALQDTNDKQL